ncbi:MAG: AAA family ATPase [Lachnospiraceae bacterium]|nr:AAA family ATPase [Lachnospiraceae bacterium]
MSSPFDSPYGKKMSSYSVEDIEKARKLQKKNGKTFMECLEEVSGKGLPNTAGMFEQNMELMRQAEEARKATEALAARVGADTAGSQLMNNSAELTKQLEELTKNIHQDFGTTKSMQEEKAVNVQRASAQAQAQAQAAAPVTEVDIEKFAGLAEVVEKDIYGQEEFIKKLIIAFKRPFVMPVEDGFAMNSIYVCGPEDTGKHSALNALAEEMYNRHILSGKNIKVMDLSLYPSAGSEKLFLQDLYEALQAEGQIVLFENYDLCHTSYLTYISSLVMTGKCRLGERYIMQKGQLVSVSNSFASSAVGSFNAKGKYLILISSRPVSKLADALGAPFINALGDVCESKKLEKEDYKKVSSKELEELIHQAEKNFLFKVVVDEEAFTEYSLIHTEKGLGVTGLKLFYEKIKKGLAQQRLEKDFPKDCELKLFYEDDNVYAQIGEEKINILEGLPKGYSGEIDAVKAEMDNIVGLTEIKKYVLGLEEYYDVMRRRKEKGLKAGELNKHMIFTGNPGTGKTTIARIISRYLKAMGVLSGGQLVEVTRADLVGRYVGHTAPLTNQVISSALGGVLFIDEAYSLYRNKDDAFGIEAIDTLVKGIEDHRDDLIVILAGYSKEMEEFLSANSGLKSRFPNIINFPDYTGQELLDITKITAKSKGYVLDEGAELPLLTYYNAVQAVRAMDAGNGRLVRNKVEEAILNQSRRLVVEKDADMSLLVSQDFDLDDVNG